VSCCACLLVLLGDGACSAAVAIHVLPLLFACCHGLLRAGFRTRESRRGVRTLSWLQPSAGPGASSRRGGRCRTPSQRGLSRRITPGKCSCRSWQRWRWGRHCQACFCSLRVSSGLCRGGRAAGHGGACRDVVAASGDGKHGSVRRAARCVPALLLTPRAPVHLVWFLAVLVYNAVTGAWLSPKQQRT
jgi:hypothetical protein